MKETTENLEPTDLTALFIPRAIQASMVTPSLAFRAHVVRDVWAIPPGSRVLEIGCGQGDCTIVLADAVGPTGHVDAVDPAPLSCGGPITYGASQRNLRASPLGTRMTFHNADPEEYLAAYAGEPYDYVVCFLSLWFFSDPARIERFLVRLLNRGDGVQGVNGSGAGHDGRDGPFAQRLLVAEWALQAAGPAAFPHLLAALSIANLEARNIEDHTNVCSPVAPTWFRALFARLQLGAATETTVAPPDDFRDGMWEVRAVLHAGFAARIAQVHGENARARLAAESMQQAVAAAVEQIDGGVDQVRSMNVWTCVVPLLASEPSS